eukprot:3780040-Pyramimonas_sp.AAC.1
MPPAPRAVHAASALSLPFAISSISFRAGPTSRRPSRPGQPEAHTSDSHKAEAHCREAPPILMISVPTHCSNAEGGSKYAGGV